MHKAVAFRRYRFFLYVCQPALRRFFTVGFFLFVGRRIFQCEAQMKENDTVRLARKGGYSQAAGKQKTLKDVAVRERLLQVESNMLLFVA